MFLQGFQMSHYPQHFPKSCHFHLLGLIVVTYAYCYSTPYSFNYSAYIDLMKESIEFIK